jgi:hypothetical protein
MYRKERRGSIVVKEMDRCSVVRTRKKKKVFSAAIRSDKVPARARRRGCILSSHS